jgi:hypothetical protein
LAVEASVTRNEYTISPGYAAKWEQQPRILFQDKVVTPFARYLKMLLISAFVVFAITNRSSKLVAAAASYPPV